MRDPTPRQARRRIPTSAAVVFALITTVATLAANIPGASGVTNPVVRSDAPDPHILVDNGVYWAYSTNSGPRNVPVRSSTDLAGWSTASDALPKLGAWAKPGRTWAPSVIRTDTGDYVLYYSAHHAASGRQCIGRAVGTRPVGPFVDDFGAPLICQLDRGGSIDPFVLRAGSELFLLWKSDDNAIGLTTHLWSQRLDPSGTWLIGWATHLLAGDQHWEYPLIENPAMIAAGGRFTLFYSASWWNSDRYAIGYAVCDTPLGPCTKMTVDGPLVASVPRVVSPGGQSVFTDTAGQPWLVYHAWDPGRVGYAAGGVRSMRLDRLSFNGSTPIVDGPTPSPPVNVAVVGVAETHDGFWTVDAAGGVRAHDEVEHFGDMSGHTLKAPVVSMAATPSGNGYWLVASDGGIFAFGDAQFHGSTGAIVLNRPVVGMASTATGGGYWLVASDGGIFAFGDAQFHGSTGAIVLNRPVVGMASTATGGGYWLVASDGGIFAFGDATFHGSTGAMQLTRPVTGMARTRNGGGYWLAGADGGVFCFGDAQFAGAVIGRFSNSHPVNGIVSRATGNYSMVNAAGDVFRF